MAGTFSVSWILCQEYEWRRSVGSDPVASQGSSFDIARPMKPFPVQKWMKRSSCPGLATRHS